MDHFPLRGAIISTSVVGSAQAIGMAESNELNETLITLTADIVSAHVSNNSVAVNDLPTLIANVHNALSGLGARAEEAPARPEPKVSIRSSIKPDYIVCLEDGKKL